MTETQINKLLDVLQTISDDLKKIVACINVNDEIKTTK
jgi:hypothetical protein